MPTRRRPAALLGPLIALILIGGITTAILRGPGSGDDNELAEPPSDTPTSVAPTPTLTAEPTATSTPDGDLSTEPGLDPDVEPVGPDASETAVPEPTDAPTPDDQATPGVGGPVGGDIDAGGVDPNITGGWTGGTPNTGTALSGMGLIVLAIGGSLLWLRRSRA